MKKVFTLNQADSAMQASAGYTAEVARTAAQAITEVDGRKSDKTHTHTAADIGAATMTTGTATLPISGWNSDNTAIYSYYYDLIVSGVTTNDRADIAITAAGASAALKCALCPSTQTLTGKIRIRSQKVPTAAIGIQYWIIKN